MNGYKFNNFKVGLSTNSNKNKKIQYYCFYLKLDYVDTRGKLERWERCSPIKEKKMQKVFSFFCFHFETLGIRFVQSPFGEHVFFC